MSEGSYTPQGLGVINPARLGLPGPLLSPQRRPEAWRGLQPESTWQLAHEEARPKRGLLAGAPPTSGSSRKGEKGGWH